MAKAKTASAEKKKKPAKAKAKTGAKKVAKKAAKKESAARKGYEALAKLAEHPLVIDLIAIGATAAVAALAGRGAGGKTGAKARSSTNVVKAAGQAAAAAVGKRLMTEYKAVKDVAASKSKKV